MTKPEFNPLINVKNQSTEPAEPPAPPPVLDTTTPAQPKEQPRRFDLGDLPRYADKMFPILKEIFPHINDRMYGGWLRGSINDNACHFTCVDGAVAMAFIGHEPNSPVPFVDVLFVMGHEQGCITLYEDLIHWCGSIGSKEVRVRSSTVKKKFLERIKGYETIEDRITYIMHVE